MTTSPYEFDRELNAAVAMDLADPMREFRGEFALPSAGEIARTVGAALPASEASRAAIYLVGNSLGAQPKSARVAVEQELDDWARLGVEGHLHGKHPWYPYHEFVREGLSMIAGASAREVVAMNSLTTNLHLLMVSFYRPTRERYKIVFEDSAFPSDSYAIQSQLEFHARHAGFDTKAGSVRLKPRAGEATLRTEDILDRIDREKDSIAMVMLGGVNYLTGQRFDMETITRFAREREIVVGWDLAHAAGNVPLRLHDWGADFAAWCSYKYLNSGPGAVAGAFVHERHLADQSLVRFAGWWGNDPTTRFAMTPDFVPVQSADAWQLSNPPILALAPLRASLEIFKRAGVDRRWAKAQKLTAFLRYLVGEIEGRPLEVTTPEDPEQRGSQLSLRLKHAGGGAGRALHQELLARGVVCDFREPDVLRAAPVPLYTTYEDVWRFVDHLREILTRK
ncbi:MAG: kynureninase [Phycisphaerales bacterium]|nr:MAG: kynureninase [Phycisphaerales bacterium]